MSTNRNKADQGIDEEMMMKLMVDGVKKEGLSLPPDNKEIEEKQESNRIEKVSDHKERSRFKKVTVADYESIFFKRSETNARDGKTVYIRPEFHEKLSRIVHVIGQDKITIYAYVDNLLEHHFSEFGEQIIRSFNEKYKPIL